jgi:hypothetical protein
VQARLVIGMQVWGSIDRDRITPVHCLVLEVAQQPMLLHGQFQKLLAQSMERHGWEQTAGANNPTTETMALSATWHLLTTLTWCSAYLHHVPHDFPQPRVAAYIADTSPHLQASSREQRF